MLALGPWKAVHIYAQAMGRVRRSCAIRSILCVVQPRYIRALVEVAQAHHTGHWSDKGCDGSGEAGANALNGMHTCLLAGGWKHERRQAIQDQLEFLQPNMHVSWAVLLLINQPAHQIHTLDSSCPLIHSFESVL